MMLQFVVHLWDTIIFCPNIWLSFKPRQVVQGIQKYDKIFSQVYLARAMSSIPKAQRVLLQLRLPELFALGATDDVTANLAQA